MRGCLVENEDKGGVAVGWLVGVTGSEELRLTVSVNLPVEQGKRIDRRKGK